MSDLNTILTSALTGGAIVALLQSFGGWRDRVGTDKRHLREQALKLAMEQWLQETKAASVHAGGGTSISVPGKPPIKTNWEYHGPAARDLHEIVFRALKFVDAFSKNEITEANLKSFYSKTDTGHQNQ